MKYLLKINLLLFLIGSVFLCQLSYAKQPSKIARALFTTNIDNREPIDQILILSNKAKEVFFFSELRHFDGKTIIHKWIYNDKVESIVKFKVKGPRWRIYSKKEVNSDQLGKWSVIIQEEHGQSIKASVFRLVDDDTQQIILPIKEQ